MSKTRKLLIICFIISVISTIIMVINSISNSQTILSPVIISAGIVPIVLFIAILNETGDTKK
ncbi:hypothetical protein [Enterococcus sp. DIV0756]|uniref:hypothetical protein n=1 Tax=Enterococcus sp. DIV0756 TaxID=2774636 RepID=UPI003F2586C8